MPWNPANMQRQENMRKNLYPNLSQKGPNTNEPIKIPIGRIENKAPEEMASNWNFACKLIATEPNVINPIPKSSIPRHAAKNICLVFCIQNKVKCERYFLKPENQPRTHLHLHLKLIVQNLPVSY